MARPPRPLVAGGAYHVTARGNRGQPIFRDDHDRVRFLGRLTRTVTERRWQPLSWCLLGNHYHLLVRTPEPDLHDGLREVNGGYAQWFNRRHELTGHLFQGRYGAKLVRSDTHLLASIRYIAHNPANAGLEARGVAWRWSSHNPMVRGDQTPLLATETVLELFGGGPTVGRERYIAFVGLPEEQKTPLPLPANLYEPDLRAVAARLGEATAMELAYNVLGLSMPNIARALGCSPTTVSRNLAARDRKKRQAELAGSGMQGV
jgi:REP element-mobilizing transposase RayT